MCVLIRGVKSVAAELSETDQWLEPPSTKAHDSNFFV